MARVESFKREATRHAKACWVVEGSGLGSVHGIYDLATEKCDGAEVFKKRNSRYALMRRQTEGWFIVDLGPSGRAGWGLKVVELYRAEQRPAGLEPPVVGWVVLRGKAPAPLLRHADRDEASNDLWDKVTCDPRQDWRKQKRKVNLSRTLSSPHELHASMQALKLPPLRPRHRRHSLLGIVQIEYLVFRITLWRPSFVIPWGFEWSEDAFRENQARVLRSVIPKSPLDRYNRWQEVRGRSDLVVSPGDRLLRTDGYYAFFDVESNSQDATSAMQAVGDNDSMPASEMATENTSGCVVLDFVRKTKTPARPAPPQLIERGHYIIISWMDELSLAGNLGGASAEAWAVCIKDLNSRLWYVFDGASGQATPLTSGSDYVAIPPDVGFVNVVLPPEGRSYAACLAIFKEGRWSAFSELSHPAMPTLYGLLRDDVEKFESNAKSHRVCFSIPAVMRPGCTAPVRLDRGGFSLNESIWTLDISTVVSGNCSELDIVFADTPGNLTVESNIYGEVTEGRRQLKLDGATLDMRLQAGDRVQSINGITDVERMIQELERGPDKLAVHLKRPFGASLEMNAEPRPLELCAELDEEMSRLSAEVLVHEIMEHAEGGLAAQMLADARQPLEKCLHHAAEAALGSVAGRYDALMKEGFYRLGLLRRMEERNGEADPIFNLRLALCDVACDPESLDFAIGQFLQLNPAMIDSKFGQNLLQRSRGLRNLWQWRRDCEKSRAQLNRLMQESIDLIFLGTKAAGGDLADLMYKPGPGEDVDEGLIEESAIRACIERLEEALEEAAPYEEAMRFRLYEAKMVLERLDVYLAENLERRRKPELIDDTNSDNDAC